MLKAVNREVIARLQDSLQQDSLRINQYLELPMEEQGEEVGRPQRQKAIPLPPETKVIDAFEQVDVAGRLLILGEPGSGKTTTLLQLAEDLINRAQQSDQVPVPVIFELSAWKNDQQSIEEWLVAQLWDNYRIREPISKQWLKNHQLLPLLDGLDELGLPRQRLCVKAINQFLQQDKLRRRLVVCCRWQEYKEEEVKLRLNGAYCLQPPNESEIRLYLQRLGKSQLWDLIQANPQMRELAEKPLFLHIMVVAYQGQAITNEEELLAAYVNERLGLRLDRKKYPQGVPYEDEKTIGWLTYLARQLEAESATEFLIENMQPYWLYSGCESFAFTLIKFLICGLIFGFICGLISRSIVLLIVLLIQWLTIGLICGLIGEDFSKNHIEPKGIGFSLLSLIVGIIGGLSVGIIHVLLGGLIVLTVWLSGGSIVLMEVIKPLIFFLNFWLIFALASVGFKIDVKVLKVPNQGIKESVKSTLIITLLTCPLGMLIYSLSYLATGVGFGLIDSLDLGLTVGLIVGILTGIQDWIPHLALRLILYQRGVIPWNYARFLKYAHDRRLIQQVGGRYRFLHDALRRHFAGDVEVKV
ncbi:MAG: NACHT domain-containing protein [Symploca sp. SIO3E6]|nr:NACHT domain-containing protein [Caldora sp. SIO3E6]